MSQLSSKKLLGFIIPAAILAMGLPFSAMAASDSHHVDAGEMHLRNAINCNNGMMKNSWSNINWDTNVHDIGHNNMHHGHNTVQWAMRVEVFRDGVRVYYHGSGWVTGEPMFNHFVPDMATNGGKMKMVTNGWRKEWDGSKYVMKAAKTLVSECQ